MPPNDHNGIGTWYDRKTNSAVAASSSLTVPTGLLFLTLTPPLVDSLDEPSTSTGQRVDQSLEGSTTTAMLSLGYTEVLWPSWRRRPDIYTGKDAQTNIMHLANVIGLVVSLSTDSQRNRTLKARAGAVRHLLLGTLRAVSLIRHDRIHSPVQLRTPKLPDPSRNGSTTYKLHCRGFASILTIEISAGSITSRSEASFACFSVTKSTFTTTSYPEVLDIQQL